MLLAWDEPLDEDVVGVHKTRSTNAGVVEPHHRITSRNLMHNDYLSLDNSSECEFIPFEAGFLANGAELRNLIPGARHPVICRSGECTLGTAGPGDKHHH